MSPYDAIGRRDLKPRRIVEYYDFNGHLVISYDWGWDLPPRQLGEEYYVPFRPWRPPRQLTLV